MATDGEDGARLEAVLRGAGTGCCEAWDGAVLRAADGEAVVVLFLPAAELEFRDGPFVLGCPVDNWGSHGGWEEQACEGSGEGDGMHIFLVSELSEVGVFVESWGSCLKVGSYALMLLWIA